MGFVNDASTWPQALWEKASDLQKNNYHDMHRSGQYDAYEADPHPTGTCLVCGVRGQGLESCRVCEGPVVPDNGSHVWAGRVWMEPKAKVKPPAPRPASAEERRAWLCGERAIGRG